MKEKTDWERTSSISMSPSEPKKGEGSSGGSLLFKAGLLACAGAIIAALAKGVKDSDYYDRD